MRILFLTQLVIFIIIICGQWPGLIYAQDINSRAGDEAALVDFYNAMDGPNWDNNTGWNGSDMSLSENIFGVETATINGELRVVKINLSGGNTQKNNSDIIGNNLTGNSIPDSFGNLKELTELRLKGNNITARIDNWVQELRSIELLSLSGSTGYGGQDELDIDDRTRYNHPSKNNRSYNKWTGTIPDDLSMLVNLDLVEIMNSNLTGSLPAQLPDGIRALFLSNNKMTGTLPSWANCINMTHLFLGTRYDSDGRWEGEIPPEWDNMTQMAWFSLETGYIYDASAGGMVANSGLTGGLPRFTSWVDLRYFETTGHSGLTFEFPGYFFTDPNKNEQLHTLDVGNSGVYGKFPTKAYNVRGLVVVAVPENSMVGILPSWHTKTSLIQYNIRDNSFTGKLPDINGRQIRWVHAENNNFTGSLPDLHNPGSSDNFTHMRFQNNQFSGDIPQSYGQITAGNFSSLQLQDNLLDGNIPNNLFGNGWDIDLSNNKYTPQNLVPILDQNLSGVTYLPQKPFGTARTVAVGTTIDMSSFDYSGNSYQWYKDGSPVSGETSPAIDTGSYGTGTYRLQITHPDINYTFESEVVEVIN